MKLKKRKLKFAAIFGICWFAFLVLLVDGILKFHTHFCQREISFIPVV